MPDLPFEYHPDAILEAQHAYHWYADRCEDAAQRFWNELVRARRLVVEHPKGWTPYFHGTRAFQFHNFPYRLVYVVQPKRIVALATCHFRRRPGYWRERM